MTAWLWMPWFFLRSARPDAFYRKTPNPKAAAAGGSRLDLDVPAFLRKQGAGGGAQE